MNDDVFVPWGCLRLNEVENRRYFLGPLDNVTIPKNCVHRVKNLSKKHPATFHVAIPTTQVEGNWIKNEYDQFIDIPEDFNGHMGSERVTHYKTSRSYSVGPNTDFIDYFNEILMPGIGMSGSYGLFNPNGRSRAHLHDFDESIYIIEGEATCFVEGCLYHMSNGDAAMQPRGRIHYFINNPDTTMSMIWVCAGPTPDRIEVADQLATEGLLRD